MFANPHVTFALLSFCYAQHLSYLLHTVFLFLSILGHYIKFNLHTIAMLEKLLSSRSFGILMGHLACCQVNLLASLKGFGLPLVV
jgi:hypothetical protein